MGNVNEQSGIREKFTARMRLTPLREGLPRTLRLAFLVIATGIAVAMAANIFRWTFVHTADFVGSFFLGPAIGGLIVGLLMAYVFVEATGHGVVSLMVAFILRKHEVRPAMAWETAVTSAITIGSGGSAGPEGPAISIGAGVGAGLARIFRVIREDDIHTIVACGAAAGLSALYSAPLAGYFFVKEVFAELEIDEFRAGMIVMSAVAAWGTALWFLPGEPFGNDHLTQVLTPVTLSLDFALGVLAAFVGIGFQLAMNGVSFAAGKMKQVPAWAKPGLGGLAVALIALAFPQVLGTGEGVMHQMVFGSLPLTLLAVIVAAKLIATALTLGSGGSGGIFTPSAFMGAALGGAFGLVVQHFIPGVSPAVFVLIGMATVIASAVHAPLTGVFLVFGLTNDWQLLAGLLVASYASHLTAKALRDDSIYSHHLTASGFRKNAGFRATVGQIMERDWPSVAEGTPLGAFLASRVGDERTWTYPILNGTGRVIGLLALEASPEELLSRNGPTLADPVEKFAVEDFVTASSYEKLSRLFRGDWRARKQELIPVEDEFGIYCGMLRNEDAWEMYGHPEHAKLHDKRDAGNNRGNGLSGEIGDLENVREIADTVCK